ncbi:MAG TPA: hypothetical protein DCW90_22815 [Lachnospiraceae bacterium]|nr:hypothetical protein [Lachnospiraceae bacterium]
MYKKYYSINDKAELIERFQNAMQYMKDTPDSGTFVWYLNCDSNGKEWAIVFGWQDGYEAYPDDKFSDGEWHLATKLAYQPYNSMMQEYNFDWTMPYNAETGEVYDNEITVYEDSNPSEIIESLLKVYSTYYEDFKEV